MIAPRQHDIDATTSRLLFLSCEEGLDVNEVAAFRLVDAVLLPAVVVVLDDLGRCTAR